ncbi:MAG: M56 family metallopeptidase [Bacteroidota bacterium]
MEIVAIYLLKMLVCSGLLYSYYRFALYNESFHQWNRFYLLASMVLSVFVPLIQIPIFETHESGNLASAVAALPWNGNLPAFKEPAIVSWQQALQGLMAFITIVLYARFLTGIIKLLFARYSNQVTVISSQVRLIFTTINHAPFSFFNWLFWRKDIDPASETGQRILTHELTHISENHSIDKLFTELLVCFFWMNPFFWLIRRELGIIHEFIADKKAVGKNNGAAFALMILQAMHLQPLSTNGLVNPFFSSQIKRRLSMITSSKEPKYSYLRRISALVVMTCAALILTLSIQGVEAQKNDKNAVVKPVTGTKKIPVKSPPKVEIVKTPPLVKSTSTDTIRVRINKKNNPDNDQKIDKIFLRGDSTKPVFILNDKEITDVELQEVNPELIESVNVVKGVNAMEAVGEKGKNGLVQIKTKDSQKGLKEVSVTGYANSKSSPLFYVDGKAISSEEMGTIKPNDIESVNVLREAKAIEKYGGKGKDGVIEITMKKKIE